MVEQSILDPDQSFGARVRRARFEKNLTLSQAATLLRKSGLDITERSYGAIERDEREPRLTEALALRDVLDVDIEPDERDTYGVSLTVVEPSGQAWTASVYGVDDPAQACWQTYEASTVRYRGVPEP